MSNSPSNKANAKNTDQALKEELEVQDCLTNQEKKFAPVSNSYLRENLYQPLTKKFTLAWENIYKMLYEPNIDSLYRENLEEPHFNSIDKAIKPLNIPAIYSKGLNSNITAGDEVYMSGISYLDKAKSVKKATINIEKYRRDLLDSVGIFYDEEDDKFKTYASQSPLKHNCKIPSIINLKPYNTVRTKRPQVEMPQIINAFNDHHTIGNNTKHTSTADIQNLLCVKKSPMKTENVSRKLRYASPTITHFNKEPDKTSPPNISLLKMIPTIVEEASSPAIRFIKVVPSDSCFENKENKNGHEEEAKFNQNTPKVSPFLAKHRGYQSCQDIQLQMAQTHRSRRNDATLVDHFISQIEQVKCMGKRCLSNCVSAQRRMNSQLSRVKGMLTPKETEFSRKDKMSMLKEYKGEKSLFLYGKNGQGHFITSQGTDYIKKSDLIAKTNPKYKFLLKKLNIL